MPQTETQQRELKEKNNPRTITIKTTRVSPREEHRDYIDIGALVSVIQFSEPVRDFKGDENSSLRLRTAHINLGHGCAAAWGWMTSLDDESGYILCQKTFGRLEENFGSYARERLQTWQEQAVDTHSEVLREIERLYLINEDLPRNFCWMD